MGMYDDIDVLIPLPDGYVHTDFQTKSLVCNLDLYQLREDGSLWHEDYDIEDHSDPKAKGMMRVRGMFARVNQRWVPVTDFTGELTFHEFDDDTFYEYSTYFVDGQLLFGPIRIGER